MRAQPEHSRRMLTHFLESFVPDDHRWLKLSSFREAVFLEIGPDHLIEGMLTAMVRRRPAVLRELFFYEAALSLSYHATDSQSPLRAALRPRG